MCFHLIVTGLGVSLLKAGYETGGSRALRWLRKMRCAGQDHSDDFKSRASLAACHVHLHSAHMCLVSEAELWSPELCVGFVKSDVLGKAAASACSGMFPLGAL